MELAFLVILDPEKAIEEHAVQLTPEQKDRCIGSHAALVLCHASPHLSEKQIDECIRKSSVATGLRFASQYMTPAQFDRYLRIDPWTAVEKPDRLNPEQLRYCCEKHPEKALAMAAHRLPPKSIGRMLRATLRWPEQQKFLKAQLTTGGNTALATAIHELGPDARGLKSYQRLATRHLSEVI